MRALLTILTLGAAGAGYAYLQLPSAVGEPYSPQIANANAKSVDWNLIGRSKNRDARIPVKELVNRIHERARSALDEFADRHGGHSDAPGDDAFQRLRQVTQSAVFAASNPSETTGSEAAVGTARVPMPNSDELQRTAFDVAAAETRTQKPAAADPKPQPVAEVKPLEKSETAKSSQPVVVSSEKLVAANNPSEETDDQAKSEATIRPHVKPVSDRTTKSIEAKWKVVGKTTEGRPMHTMRLGDSGSRTLVIAGLNGDDPTAVRWLELLTEELRRRSDLLDNNEIIFFRAGNPDGLVRNKRNNSRGVLLNQNFPSRRFRNQSDKTFFAPPASEAETRVILDTLYSFRPRRVIHLTSTNGPSLVLYNRLAKGIAGEFEQASRLPIREFTAAQVPGSIEGFADGTLEAAVLSMRVSAENDWQKAWNKVQARIVETVAGKLNQSAIEKDVEQPDLDRSIVPPMTDDELPRRNPRRRGYEELPPPPKADSASQSAGK